MRIAMISEHASPLAALGGVDAGGQNAHVAALAREVAAQGHEVCVYTRRDDPDLPAAVDLGGGVTVRHVPAGPAVPLPKDDLINHMDEFGAWLDLCWRSPRRRPDVIHAHFWMSGLAALAARRRFRIPVVQTFHALGAVKRRHQGAADTSPACRIRDERRLGGCVDRVLAQCADEVSELLAMGVPAERIAMAPSGVDTELFRPDGAVAGSPSGRPRILTVGRLVERKGYADLIAAMPSAPDAELVIVGGAGAADGDDPLAQRLTRQAADVGVADRVRLVGSVAATRMPAWYRSADVVACPAWYEPFGLIPLEAMASGVPVVAYAVGGFLDTIIDGVTGDLAPARDVDALGRALAALVADPDRRRAYGAAGRRRACARYTWSRTAADVCRAYSETTVSHVDTRAKAVVV